MKIKIPNDLPHGHRKSFRRGIADALLSKKNYKKIKSDTPGDLPNGHGRSYKRGLKFGIKLSEKIKKNNKK